MERVQRDRSGGAKLRAEPVTNEEEDSKDTPSKDSEFIMHIPANKILRHLTHTTGEVPMCGTRSFKEFYSTYSPWPKQCAMCNRPAALGAHMEAELSISKSIVQVVRGIVPSCHGCNHNLRHKTKTYRSQQPLVMVLLDAESIESINDRQVQATSGGGGDKTKSQDKVNDDDNNKPPPTRTLCKVVGCQRNICSKTKPRCGGYSRNHCCIHYHINIKGQVACRVRRELEDLSNEKMPVKDSGNNGSPPRRARVKAVSPNSKDED
jgi:hypothetical protein